MLLGSARQVDGQRCQQTLGLDKPSTGYEQEGVELKGLGAAAPGAEALALVEADARREHAERGVSLADATTEDEVGSSFHPIMEQSFQSIEDGSAGDCTTFEVSPAPAQAEAAVEDPAATPVQDAPSLKTLVLKVTLTMLLFVLVSYLVEFVAKEHVAALSSAFVENLGLPGLFVCMFICEGLPLPIPYIPFVFLAVKGAVPKLVVFAVCASASYAAAVFGYSVGRCLREPSRGKATFRRLRARYPVVAGMMESRGACGVLLMAFVPIPFAAVTWTAGFFAVNARNFLAAALGRWPKIAIFVLLSVGPDEASVTRVMYK